MFSAIKNSGALQVVVLGSKICDAHEDICDIIYWKSISVLQGYNCPHVVDKGWKWMYLNTLIVIVIITVNNIVKVHMNKFSFLTPCSMWSTKSGEYQLTYFGEHITGLCIEFFHLELQFLNKYDFKLSPHSVISWWETLCGTVVVYTMFQEESAILLENIP